MGEPFLDDLFRNRCVVVHGHLFTPPQAYAEEIRRFSVDAIERFSTEIENSVVQESYLCKKTAIDKRIQRTWAETAPGALGRKK